MRKKEIPSYYKEKRPLVAINIFNGNVYIFGSQRFASTMLGVNSNGISLCIAQNKQQYKGYYIKPLKRLSKNCKIIKRIANENEKFTLPDRTYNVGNMIISMLPYKTNTNDIEEGSYSLYISKSECCKKLNIDSRTLNYALYKGYNPVDTDKGYRNVYFVRDYSRPKNFKVTQYLLCWT